MQRNRPRIKGTVHFDQTMIRHYSKHINYAAYHNDHSYGTVYEWRFFTFYVCLNKLKLRVEQLTTQRGDLADKNEKIQFIENQNKKWKKHCDDFRDLNEDLQHQVDDVKKELENLKYVNTRVQQEKDSILKLRLHDVQKNEQGNDRLSYLLIK